MNKKRYIRQMNFNDRLNGYHGYSYGDYDTPVNDEHIGLDNWRDEFKYYIR